MFVAGRVKPWASPSAHGRPSLKAPEIMKSNRIIATALVAAVISVTAATGARPALADAVKGVVVWTGSCGGRYVAETTLGYVLLEWYGGMDPSKGDVIIGDLNSYGMKDLFVSQPE